MIERAASSTGRSQSGSPGWRFTGSPRDALDEVVQLGGRLHRAGLLEDDLARRVDEGEVGVAADPREGGVLQVAAGVGQLGVGDATFAEQLSASPGKVSVESMPRTATWSPYGSWKA